MYSLMDTSVFTGGVCPVRANRNSQRKRYGVYDQHSTPAFVGCSRQAVTWLLFQLACDRLSTRYHKSECLGPATCKRKWQRADPRGEKTDLLPKHNTSWQPKPKAILEPRRLMQRELIKRKATPGCPLSGYYQKRSVNLKPCPKCSRCTLAM